MSMPQALIKEQVKKMRSDTDSIVSENSSLVNHSTQSNVQTELFDNKNPQGSIQGEFEVFEPLATLLYPMISKILGSERMHVYKYLTLDQLALACLLNKEETDDYILASDLLDNQLPLKISNDQEYLANNTFKIIEIKLKLAIKSVEYDCVDKFDHKDKMILEFIQNVLMNNNHKPKLSITIYEESLFSNSYDFELQGLEING
jgi:hypothetical protein